MEVRHRLRVWNLVFWRLMYLWSTAGLGYMTARILHTEVEDTGFLGFAWILLRDWRQKKGLIRHLFDVPCWRWLLSLGQLLLCWWFLLLENVRSFVSISTGRWLIGTQWLCNVDLNTVSLSCRSSINYSIRIYSIYSFLIFLRCGKLVPLWAV